MSFIAPDVKSVACAVIQYLLKQLWAFLDQLVPDVVESILFYDSIKWDFIFCFPRVLGGDHHILLCPSGALEQNNCRLRVFYIVWMYESSHHSENPQLSYIVPTLNEVEVMFLVSKSNNSWCI